jgi:hypothetical protein
MKGKIDKYGNLYIERVDKMKSQSCPFKEKSEHDYFENCNDECPMFGEPKPTIDIGLYGRSEKTGQTTIEICHRDLIFDEFTDERIPEVCTEAPHD